MRLDGAQLPNSSGHSVGESWIPLVAERHLLRDVPVRPLLHPHDQFLLRVVGEIQPDRQRLQVDHDRDEEHIFR